MLTLSETLKAIDLITTSKKTPGIIGRAGIGKSQMIEQLAEEKGAFLRIINCSTLQEGDLALPYKDDGKLVKVTKSSLGGATSDETEEEYRTRISFAYHEALESIIAFHEIKGNEEKLSYLFLDEYNRSTVGSMAETMNLVLQRRINSFELPKNTRVILAMNPNQDFEEFKNEPGYAVNTADDAIYDRVTWLFMEANTEDWLTNFATSQKVVTDFLDRPVMVPSEEDPDKMIPLKRNAIHEEIAEFISENPDLLHTEKPKNDVITSTPRSWEMASDILYDYYESNVVKDPKIISEILRGTIGIQNSINFMTYLASDRKPLVKPAEIFAEGNTGLTKEIHDKLKEDIDKPVRLSMVCKNVINWLTPDPSSANGTKVKGPNDPESVRYARIFKELWDILPSEIQQYQMRSIYETNYHTYLGIKRILGDELNVDAAELLASLRKEGNS